jgi:hypothetical protein
LRDLGCLGGARGAIWFWQTPELGRPAVVPGCRDLRHVGHICQAARLSDRRHHPAAAHRLPVADLGTRCWASSCSPVSRYLDVRRRRDHLRQRHLHLAP